MKFLTKSLYMSRQQCPRLLWFSSRHQLPEPSLYDQHKFAQGRDFEKYVKKLFPDGIDLSNLNHGENIKETQNLIRQINFLVKREKDPRPELLVRLEKEIGQTGNVIAFNKTFETGVLKKLAEDFPEYESLIKNTINRIIDLAEPFRNFDYYNPVQRGRYSLKAVLPAVTGKGYSNLEINNGTDASMKYFYSHIKDDLKNKDEIRNNLLKYCGLDTEGMIWIIEELNRIV